MGGSKHICNTQCINHNFPPLANVVPFVVKAPLLNYQNGGEQEIQRILCNLLLTYCTKKSQRSHKAIFLNLIFTF